MKSSLQRKMARTRFDFHDFHPSERVFLEEVKSGLSRTPKSLPPKLFYDDEGSQLFSEICETKEYYPTRIETKILLDHQEEIADLFHDPCAVIEYGCGNSEKARKILDAAAGCRAYAAVEISKKPLLELSDYLAECYPYLRILAICADFLQPLAIPVLDEDLKKIAFFPGSSIGNLKPPQAKEFLANVANSVGRNGGLLIGVDLKKDSKILDRAYNDAGGVTARFNKNLLERINRECDANFDLDEFGHRAFYSEEKGRIEMHLVSLQEQEVRIDGNPFHFRRGETIHTENSYKYRVDEFQVLAMKAGWRPVRVWCDPNRMFSVHYLETRG